MRQWYADYQKSRKKTLLNDMKKMSDLRDEQNNTKEK